jgi:hypothetical protein
VRHLDRPGDAGREADAVVGPGDVVVHRLRERDDLEALLVEADAVRERVVPSDRDQDVDTELPDVREDLGGEVVHLVRVAVAEMLGDVRPRNVRGAGPGGVEERPSGPADLVDDLLGELHDAVAVGPPRDPVQLDQAGPAPADAEDPVAVPERPDRDRPDGRVQAGHVSSPRQNRDRSALRPHVRHRSLLPFRPGIISPRRSGGRWAPAAALPGAGQEVDAGRPAPR